LGTGKLRKFPIDEHNHILIELDYLQYSQSQDLKKQRSRVKNRSQKDYAEVAMPRIGRMVVPDQKTVYHVMSRTALDGFPFGGADKDELIEILKRLNRLYFTELIGFAIMGNHFHVLVRMIPGHHYSDKQIRHRYKTFYGNDDELTSEKIHHFRQKWQSLSEFIKDVKQTFSRYYNKRHHRRGTLWGERFKSLIVQDGNTLINCLAYIDLNPLRAGIVKRPEHYRWSSIGYHMQTNNKDDFLSLDFGLQEFCVKQQERLERYRRYLYEAGAVDNSQTGQRKVIDHNVLEKERKKQYRISRSDRFLYRTRYFSDSGIIGSKAFVLATYQRFKHHFNSKNEKIPKPIKGLDGLHSLKRLAEA
jgi:REP element-mobilizing transposase RayT